jgi:two-component system nitrate/nitrite response regulator NarL
MKCVHGMLACRLHRPAAMADICIAVFDDRPLFRAGVINALREETDIVVIGEGSTAEDALHLAKELGPQIILLNANLHGGGFSGIGMQELLAVCPAVKLLILSATFETAQVYSAMRAGAWGVALDCLSGAELVQSIRLIHGGERYVAPVLAVRLLAAPAMPEPAPDPFAGLSSREEQVLAFMARGLSNKEIGSKLKLSHTTVKRHVSTTLDKLGVKSRVQAVIIAQKR